MNIQSCCSCAKNCWLSVIFFFSFFFSVLKSFQKPEEMQEYNELNTPPSIYKTFYAMTMNHNEGARAEYESLQWNNFFVLFNNMMRLLSRCYHRFPFKTYIDWTDPSWQQKERKKDKNRICLHWKNWKRYWKAWTSVNEPQFLSLSLVGFILPYFSFIFNWFFSCADHATINNSHFNAQPQLLQHNAPCMSLN